jgi:hypothetical protein
LFGKLWGASTWCSFCNNTLNDASAVQPVAPPGADEQYPILTAPLQITVNGGAYVFASGAETARVERDALDSIRVTVFSRSKTAGAVIGIVLGSLAATAAVVAPIAVGVAIGGIR